MAVATYTNNKKLKTVGMAELAVHKKDIRSVRSLSAPGVACCVHLPLHLPDIKLASPLTE